MHLETERLTIWQRWLQYPEKSRVREAFFQIHYWTGTIVAVFVLLMSISGSAIVFRNELDKRFSVEWLVDLHENLLFGSMGRFVIGIGAICVTLLCITGAIIWWPGIRNWRRSLTVDWTSHFARINWDLHSALGFWCFFFVFVWGISGIYFVFPHIFEALYVFDPSDSFTTQSLFRLSELHFGRFGWFGEALWTALGLVPAVLAFTGFFICCRRVIFKSPSNPNTKSA
jgi:uncharacterized iron-regulated membrane protein